MKRFNWLEMQEYWKLHSNQWSQFDYEQDPDGLVNVQIAGAPLWLNRHIDRWHKVVYNKLLAMVPPPKPGVKALDIGCGAARWSKLLSAKGYHTVGIDLQPDLIELNRKRYPQIEFFNTPVQEFSSEPFDLISVVTVIQHVPFEEHGKIFRKIRELMKPGGYLLVLENIYDQLPHLFSHSIDEWQSQFMKVGFQPLAMKHFNYDLFIKLHLWIMVKAASVLKPKSTLDKPSEEQITPEKFLARSNVSQTANKPVFHKLNLAAQRVAVAFDSVIEPILIQANVSLPSAHAGFLFQLPESASRVMRSRG